MAREGTRRLQAAGLAHARFEAEWLLGRLVGMSPLELYLREEELPPVIAERFLSQIEARSAGTPFQYLLGEADFCGQPFIVRAGVFIPRPETETIIEHALRELRARQAPTTNALVWGQAGRAAPLRLLDLGTGSGCIAVTLARALPTCVVVGVELSWVALRVALQNVLRHGQSGRVHLVQGRWTQPLRGLFDGVIANPPYVPSAQVDHLPVDVRQEPRMSLDGGDDGMQCLGEVLSRAPQVLAPDGILVLECGEEQAPALVRTARGAGWVRAASLLEDLAGRPRGVLVVRASR